MRARTGGFSVILGVGLLAASAAVATAQQPSVTKVTQMGQPETSTSTRVVHATVVSVNGNKVVAEDAAGKATEYTIPDGFKFQFGGKDIGVADLKPGMKVSAKITTTTTTTPVYVTEIKSGKVLAVSGTSVIVRGPQGNRVFTNQDAVKRNARIMRNGQQVEMHELRVGDIFTAVIVTDEAPKVVSEREVEAMVHAAPQPASAPARAPAAGPRGCPYGSPSRGRCRARAHGSRGRCPRCGPHGGPRRCPGRGSGPGSARAGERVSELAPVASHTDRDPGRRVPAPPPQVLTTTVCTDRGAAGLSGPAVTALADSRKAASTRSAAGMTGRIPSSIALQRIESGSLPHRGIPGVLPDSSDPPRRLTSPRRAFRPSSTTQAWPQECGPLRAR